jgi:hypothetical protein
MVDCDNGAVKRPDWFIAAALFAAACVIGFWYVRAFNSSGGATDGTRTYFAAAVSLACGQGYVDRVPYSRALQRFLDSETDSVPCSELSSSAGPDTTFMRLYRYLMSAAAVVWMLRGRVAWSALWPLHGLLYGLTIVAAYSLFRAFISIRPIAVAAAVALLASSVHLSHLPLYRDYAKAPFIIGLISMMAWMARGPYRRSTLLWWSAAFGAVLGLGFGFRNDVLVSIPPFLLIVWCWAGGPPAKNLAAKAAAVALCAVTFVAVSWPVLRGYAQGSNSGHATLTGVMANTYDEALGVRGSIYDWAYMFHDEFTYAVLESYAYRVHGAPIAFGTQGYDRLASEYLTQVVRNTPADTLAHIYGSTIRILEMPYTVGLYANAVPQHAETSAFVRGVYGWQAWLISFGLRAAVPVAIAALVMAAASSFWGACTGLLLLVYYAGYPILQFQHRHYFHLEFIGWLALGFVVDRVVRAVASAVAERRSGRTVSIPWRLVTRATAFVVVAFVFVAGGLAVVRMYQQAHLRSMFDAYLNEPRERLQTSLSTGSGTSLIGAAGLWAGRPREEALAPISAQYVVAEFSGETCGAARLPVTFRYAARERLTDFSRRMMIALGGSHEPTRVFFPAYYYLDASHFAGVEVPSRYASCVQSLSRVTDTSRHPLLMDVTFEPGWRNTRLFDTLAAVEPRQKTGALYVTTPDELVITRSMLDSGAAEQPVQQAGFVTQAASTQWILRGRPDIPRAALLGFAPRSVKRAAVLVVKGDARRGRFRIGLVDGSRWVADVRVGADGPFVAAVQAPEDGHFGVAIDADLPERWPAKYFGHRLGPLFAWIPGATFSVDLTLQQVALVAGP